MLKVGMRVQHEDGRRGTVVGVNALVNVAWDNGTTSLEIAARLTLVGVQR